MKNTLTNESVIALVALVASTAASYAAPSYSELKSSGFSSGPMTRNKAGILGWNVRNGFETYFCRFRAGVVNNNNELKRGNPRPNQVGYCSKKG